METTEIYAGIEMAIETLRQLKAQATSVHPVWAKLHHAIEHLEKEVAAMLAPPVEVNPIQAALKHVLGPTLM